MAEIFKAILAFKYTSPVLMALVIIGAVIFYRVTTRKMRQFAVNRAYKAQNALRFFFIWRYVFMFAVGVVVIFFFSDVFGMLGITLAFVMTLLSWGIRNPIMNMAAWLMIVLRKPYRIGDRVILGGLTGDVKDISITYTLLEQVGGTVGGEEKSGRSLMVPNHHLFSWTIINYTLDEKYILDEVPVRLTFDSDIERAEEIMNRHAREVTADVVAETGAQPFVRFEMQPWGIMTRVRYRVLAVDRQKISTFIVDRLFDEFNRTPSIRFAYNVVDTAFVPKGDQSAPPPQHPGWFRDSLIRPWFEEVRR